MIGPEEMWQDWLRRLYNLRRDKRGTHERPHKPILLLSIIDLLDRHVLNQNEVPLSNDLIGTFGRFFDVVREKDDRPSIENPFFHLSGDGFWHLQPAPGQERIYREGAASGSPGVAELRRRVAYGTFDERLWNLLSDPGSRHQLREALIARYFPERREQLEAQMVQNEPIKSGEEARQEFPPGRDAAFRRTVLEIYDFRCAACGMRVLVDQQISLVEAAHLIPFGVTRNDRPTNGLALCPNHHWAMDRYLIAPCPDTKRQAGIWRINDGRLDDRIEGQRELVALAGKPVIPPSEEKYYPAVESLRWREEHLGTGS